MDEAYVVLVADSEGRICQAFPFATKHGAEMARDWFRSNGPATAVLIDDHERAIEGEFAGDDRRRGWDGPDVTLE